MKNIQKIAFLSLTMMIMTLQAFSRPTESWKEIGHEDNILILSKTAKNAVLPFKAIGEIEADIETLLAILKDHTQKQKWAPKLEKVTIHKELSENIFIFSEYYKTPWPATDREFLLKGEIIKLTKNTVLLKAHSVDQEKAYEHFKSENHIQADVKYLNLTLSKVSANRTAIEFEFHGDMKGWMPLWLMNLIQKKWPLRFIQGLREHSLSYKNHNLKTPPNQAILSQNFSQN